MQDHFWYEPLKPRESESGGESDGAVTANPGPKFRIRMGSLIERGEFDAELDGRHGASAVPAFIMLDTAIAGARALLEADDAAQIEELLRSVHSSAEDGEVSEIGPHERQQVAEIQAVLAKSWPDYRHLVERNARYRQLMPLLAFQRWCDGWENLTGTDGKPVEYTRDKAGNIPEATLRRIAPALIYAAGNRAYNFQYATGEEKN